MQDSLSRSALRSLLVTFSALIGLFLAFFVLVLLYEALGSDEDEITNEFTAEIRPNAKGVRKKQSSSAPVVLEVQISGIIGTAELSQKTIENLLVESRENSLKDNRVKGILLHINSPGGSVSDADGIYKALKAYKEQYKVPIYAFADGLCASGGMYVAVAADEIYASDITLVGSIGVITNPFLNVSDLMSKVGVSALTLSAGIGKDELDPLRPWKKDEDKNLKEIIDSYYASFVDLVVLNRPKVDKKALISEYGAQVFRAPTAKKIGFIDHDGASRSVVLKALLAKIGIEDDYYQVVGLESTRWFNQLFQSKSPLITGKIKHEILSNTPEELSGKLLYLYRP